jgi:hypothetical protein
LASALDQRCPGAYCEKNNTEIAASNQPINATRRKLDQNHGRTNKRSAIAIANVQKQRFENVSVSSPHQESTSVTCTAMKNRRHPVAVGCGVVVIMMPNVIIRLHCAQAIVRRAKRGDSTTRAIRGEPPGMGSAASTIRFAQSVKAVLFR